MPASKMSAEEMTLYYKCLHQQSLARDRIDSLRAVIGPDASAWVNRFTDFAHRQGMKHAFRVLESEWISLHNRSVLDLGCGRGRWSKKYAARGARVTGVDISQETISIVAGELPEHHFIAADIAELALPEKSFDLVNAVTVLQHMPQPKQQIALSKAWRWLTPGGRLVLLENISAFGGPHVFPHRTEEWIAMVEANGFRCSHCWGSNFEALLRSGRFVLQRLRGNDPVISVPRELAPQRRLKSAVGAALAIASFPVEWACHRVPIAQPTHSVMMFRKSGAA
jgi:2-polyprenyl-3-methyl-5-hydroxy-6-metoxy-1,4-benzoquinol methylase